GHSTSPPRASSCVFVRSRAGSETGAVGRRLAGTDTSPVELLRSTDARIERLGELFAAADARAAGLTAEQRAKSEDPALLDGLLSADLSGPDAHLGEAVEIRRIGRGLFDEGGGLWMVAVAARTTELHPVTTSRITAAWKGIGDW
ncbi:hypothetical protein ABZ901_03450, partial [Actinacidiphila alni]|uniref:hypothetical protein n=1 Tax=Actinacidiphila alni TaxID=380248 RepID=UPI003411A452